VGRAALSQAQRLHFRPLFGLILARTVFTASTFASQGISLFSGLLLSSPFPCSRVRPLPLPLHNGYLSVFILYRFTPFLSVCYSETVSASQSPREFSPFRPFIPHHGPSRSFRFSFLSVSLLWPALPPMSH